MTLKHITTVFLLIIALTANAQASVRLKLNLKVGDRYKITSEKLYKYTIVPQPYNTKDSIYTKEIFYLNVIGINEDKTYNAEIKLDTNLTLGTDDYSGKNKFNSITFGLTYNVVLDTMGKVLKITNYDSVFFKINAIEEKLKGRKNSLKLQELNAKFLANFFTEDTLIKKVEDITFISFNKLRLNDSTKYTIKPDFIDTQDFHSYLLFKKITPTTYDFIIANRKDNEVPDVYKKLITMYDDFKMYRQGRGNISYYKTSGLVKLRTITREYIGKYSGETSVSFKTIALIKHKTEKVN